MRITTEQTVAFSPAFGIDMAAIGTLAGAPGRAASGSFGRVGPGQATSPHQHDEIESFVIVAGEGELIVDNVAHRVALAAVGQDHGLEGHESVLALEKVYQAHHLGPCGQQCLRRSRS